MKKIIVLLSAFFSLFICVHAYANDDIYFHCGTKTEFNELNSNLINDITENHSDGISLMSIWDNRFDYYRGRMPSTGNVKMLVLPIEFVDCKISDEEYSDIKNNFFGDYDANRRFQSLKIQYEAYSYGKLHISGDVLPVYTANINRSDCEGDYGDTLLRIVNEALNSYEFLHNNLSQYDSDGDGYLDALHMIFAGEESGYGSLFWPSMCVVNLTSPDKEIKIRFMARESVYSGTYTIAHETAHLLGFSDNNISFEDRYLGDITASTGIYFNMYLKYLLGWISEEEGSVLFLTYDDVIDGKILKDIELYAAETRGESSSEKLKAVFIVPDKTLVPFTEFWAIEYRAGGVEYMGYDYSDSPGVLIWHCDTDCDATRPIGDDVRKEKITFMRPIYKSNSGNKYDPPKDLYFAGDEFSAETTPSSNFYNDVYTGAYIKVNSIDSEKATITAGFKDIEDIPSPPTVKIEPDVSAVTLFSGTNSKKYNRTITYKITYDNYTDVPFMVDGPYFGYIKGRNYIVNNFGEADSANQDDITAAYPQYELTGENTGIVKVHIPWTSGDGWVSITLGAGTAVNGLIPAPRVTSPIVYVDSTPPEIKINGDSEIRWEYGKEYVDPGAEVTDNLDPDPASRLVIDSSEVNPNKIGTYSVYYNATDHAGNKAKQVVRTVTVFDPFIKDIQYSATELTNQDVTVTLIPYEGVTSETGFSHTFTENDEYTFDLTDAEGNTAKRTVEVTWIDKTPPTAEVIYTPSTWTNRSVDVKLIPSEPIIEERTNITWGSNTDRTFKITDLAGNVSLIPIKITWFDNTKPVIKLKGDSEITLKVGEQYIEQGAEVTDNLDPDIASKLVIDDSDVNTGTVGTYYVYYDATDHATNKANQVVRTVNVREARTISFVNYDKSILQSEDVALGTIPEYKGETPAKPSDDGYSYRFTGWLPEITEVTENATYTAQFEEIPREYTVTLNKNGGECEELTSYTYGEKTTLPTPTKTEHTFGGWYENENYDGKAVVDITPTDTGDKTYYAKWIANTYTVTLNKNGGDCEELTSYTYGVGATLPEPKKTGYTFDGWYENENYDGKAVVDIKPTDTGDKTYYAKWIANTYTVTLNKNGGECEDLTNYTYGVGATLPEPTKTGYTFDGWYENENYDGEAVDEIAPTDTGDKTYYAKWTANTYTVTLNKNGGKCEDLTSYTYGEKTTLPTPTKTGYTFDGWYENENYDGEAVTEIKTTDTGEKTYYAKWIANTYTVTLNKNGGECEDLTNYTYGVGATLPEPTKTGYTFDGWYENKNYDGEAVVDITPTDTGNKTYYAKWTANTYTVTLNKNGGDCEELTSYTYGVGATLPEPTKTGYTFGGWYENENYDGEAVVDIKPTDTGDKTYYAKWTKDEPAHEPRDRVEFTRDGGEVTVRLIFEKTLPPPENEIRVFAVFSERGVFRYAELLTVSDMTAQFTIPEKYAACDVSLYVWDKNLCPLMNVQRMEAEAE